MRTTDHRVGRQRNRSRNSGAGGLVISAIAVAVVAAGCSGSTSSESLNEPTTNVTDAPTTTTEEKAATTESKDTNTLDTGLQDASFLVSVKGVEPSGAGWVLKPGVWTTPRVGTPMTFETTEELALVDNEDGFVTFGPPGFTFETFDSFVLAQFEGVALPTGPDTEPEVEDLPDDLGVYFEDSQHLALVDSGSLLVGDNEIEWWEVAADASDSISFPCQYGERCTQILVHSLVGPFQLGEGETYRVRMVEMPPTPNSIRIFGWVQAPVETFDSFWSSAEAVFSSVRYEGPESEEASYDLATGAPFAQVVTGPLAAGRYLGQLGDTKVDLALKSDLPEVTLQVGSPDALLFSRTPTEGEDNPDSPSFSVTTLIGFLTAEESALLPNGPPTEGQVVGFEVDVGAHFATIPGLRIDDNGSTTIGGQTADWWQLSVPDDVSADASFDCGAMFGPPGARCVEVLGTPWFGEILYPGFAARIYVLSAVELIIIVDGPPEVLDSWIDEVEPFLDGLTIG